MAEDTGKKSQDTEKHEDLEEVAAREAGHDPETEKASRKIVRANAEAEKEASTDEDGDQVDPAVHVPRTVEPRKRS